jgi:hypothetical protein
MLHPTCLGSTEICHVQMTRVMVTCMANVTITMPEELKREMKKRKSTNWSSVARGEFEEAIRQEEMGMAAEGINRLRSSAQTSGWIGAKEIRKWRDASKSS